LPSNSEAAFEKERFAGCRGFQVGFVETDAILWKRAREGEARIIQQGGLFQSGDFAELVI